MIEVVYKENGKNTGNGGRINLPKNIRQIGEPEEHRKIYIEDYVITYLKRLSGETLQNGQAAVLLGNSEWMDGIPYLFIRSAISLKNIDFTPEGIPFTDEIWTEIYGEMKEYFERQDILGWFLSMPGYPLPLEDKLLKTHLNYFGGVDKVLLVREPLSEEEDFFAYENGQLTRQKGYYIFYERNEKMQRYMVETGDGESIDEKEAFEDRAARSFRTIVQEKREASSQKRIMTFLYAASTFLVMVILVIGITLINNYEKMEGLEMALSELSQSLENQNNSYVEAYGEQAEKEKQYSGEELAEAMAQENQKIQETFESAESSSSEEPSEPAERPLPEESSEPAESPSTEEPSESVETYIVQKGDTLHEISRKLYGNEEQIGAICELNGIEDSDRILVGQKLLLP